MNPPASISAKRGFTLVELLVAIAVLSLLIILVSKIVGGASTIATYNNSHMDSNDQARLVFDRMALDFSRMLKRPDADIIFCKNTDEATGLNDTMFFFSESSGNAESTTNWTNEKNNIALVGYRVNNNYNSTNDPNCGQLERLGKALPWDAAAVTPSSSGSTDNTPIYRMVYLSYPQPGTTPASPAGNISTAYTATTLQGVFGAEPTNTLPNALGTLGSYFTDSADTDYHVLGSQVFRFEYSFLLKDGTQSDIPIIQSIYNSQNPPSSTNLPNGAPTFSFVSSPPISSQDTNSGFYVGSRLYDTTNHVGYICTDAGIQSLSGHAVWKQIGTQDISAIVVTIATLDNATRYFIDQTNNNTTSSINDALAKIAAQFPKYTPPGQATNATPTPADNLVTSWENEITPTPGTQTSPLASAPGVSLPQNMISRIRIYQRFFYLNTP